MAVSIDWGTGVITVPKADTSLVSAGPPEIRSYNVDNFRLSLKALEDDFEGAPYPRTHNHTAPLSVGGVTLARAVEIINNYTVTFENGSYAVNLEGANNNIGDVLNLNNVQVRSANSAGLTYSKQVEDQSFLDGRVFIDTANGQTGTDFPLGTPGLPVNNLADAQAIIAARTLPKRLFVRGTLAIGASQSVANYNISGTSALLTILNFVSGSVATNCVINGCTVVGAVTGGVRMTDNCILGATSVFEGSMVDSALAAATTTLTNTDAQNIIGLFNCTSIVAGTETPVIDCNGVANLELNIRNYTGGIEIRGFTDATMSASIDVNVGRVVLHSSNTAGTIVVRGIGRLVDNSAGATVDSTGFINAALLEEALFAGEAVIDVVNGVALTATGRTSTGEIIGTRAAPVNSLADAQTISTDRGLSTLRVLGALTVGAAESLNDHIVRGEGATFNLQTTAITLTSGNTTSGTQFFDCYVTGAQGGETRYERCILENLTNSHCSYQNCGFIGTHTLPAGGFDTHVKDVLDCYTGRSGLTWDMNGSNMDTRFVRFSGDITFVNATGVTANIYLNMAGGTVTLDPTCTAGNIYITGNCTVTDNSAGMTVNTDGMVLTAGMPMTESYPVDGQANLTPSQAMYAITQLLTEFSRSGTTISVKKRDGTEAFQLTLDSATAPTSTTQST